MKIKTLFNKFFNSPTLMTWMSYSTKAGSLLLIIPLVLKKFESGDIALWFLFSSFLGLSNIIDLGFRNVFIRLIAQAYAGVQGIKRFDIEIDPRSHEGGTNFVFLNNLYSMMSIIYRYLTLVVIIFLSIIGTFFIKNPIGNSSNISESWLAWAILIVGISIEFYGKKFLNFLEGSNEIALVRRVETFLKLGTIISNFIVLIYAPSFLNLVISNCFWLAVNFLRNKILAYRIQDGILKQFRSYRFDKKLFFEIWPLAWKGGFSGFMSQGLTSFTGILYAQVADPSALSAYMLCLKLVSEIRSVSNAPFYSKIPLFSKLRASNSINELIAKAQRAMKLSHYIFIILSICVGFFFNIVLDFLSSDIERINPLFWMLLTTAFYIHRYGAMHMQLYLSTNHVISHIADFVAGFLFVVSSLLLFNNLGVIAIPIGMIIGYLGFYSWFSAYFSLKSIKYNFFEFEKKASLVPMSIFVLYNVYVIIVIWKF